ncbi:MAG: ABC transporter permease [Deltaproteobacteria bacterium]|nr:ABC transporter permease [Deltaproteobacteria bacterium]
MAILVTLKSPIAAIGREVLDFTQHLGSLFLFFMWGFVLIFQPPFQFDKFRQQVYFIGMKSVFVICLTGAFTGMVLGLQGYYALVRYGSTAALGSAVALSLVREMGPVLTAIMIIARAGSSMTAEIGIMRISEQIDALRTMDINPMRFLVSPRIAAALICFPLLTALFDVVGLYGGYLSGSALLGLNPAFYFARAQSSVEMSDIIGGFIKSIAFAVVVVTVCCFQGYYTHTRAEFGAKGVSISTTSAVVISCVLVLVTDYVLTTFLL